jgi:hypothetical protein
MYGLFRLSNMVLPMERLRRSMLMSLTVLKIRLSVIPRPSKYDFNKPMDDPSPAGESASPVSVQDFPLQDTSSPSLIRKHKDIGCHASMGGTPLKPDEPRG